MNEQEEGYRGRRTSTPISLLPASMSLSFPTARAVRVIPTSDVDCLFVDCNARDLVWQVGVGVWSYTSTSGLVLVWPSFSNLGALLASLVHMVSNSVNVDTSLCKIASIKAGLLHSCPHFASKMSQQPCRWI